MSERLSGIFSQPKISGPVFLKIFRNLENGNVIYIFGDMHSGAPGRVPGSISIENVLTEAFKSADLNKEK